MTHYQKYKESQKKSSLKYYCRHRDEILPKMRRRGYAQRIEIKRTVLSHYGNGESKCVVCGEQDIRCLSIDHIDGNGANHRREVMGQRTGAGYRFYQWLIQNGFPEGFRTLCMNCQFKERFKHWGL